MSIKLYRYSTDTLFPLPQAIQAYGAILTAPDDQAYALLYDPQSCSFARLDSSGMLRDAKDGVVNVTTVFEAYLFNAVAELRWLHVRDGNGRVAVLSEHENLNLFGKAPCCHTLHGRIDQRYLLWGEGTATRLSTGWSQLAEARTGAFPVPVANVGAQQRVQLTAFEYLQTYEYGNVGVCEERLTGLVVADEGT
jgi:CRISPR-associated protein (TIGR03984 family)